MPGIRSESYLLTFGTCKSARITQLGQPCPLLSPNPFTTPHKEKGRSGLGGRREKNGKVLIGGRLVGWSHKKNNEEEEMGFGPEGGVIVRGNSLCLWFGK